MHRVRQSYIFIGLLVVLFGQAKAQQVTQPSIKNFKQKDYSGHVQSFAIAQDSLGMIYVANVGGLLRYDGTNWLDVDIGKHTMAMSVDIDAQGKVYVGGNGDFGTIEFSKKGEPIFTSYLSLLPDSMQNVGTVWRIHCVGSKVYFNALQNIFVLHNGKLSIIKPKREFHISFVVDGEVWVSDKNYGLYKVGEKGIKFIANSQFFVRKSVYNILPFNDDYKLAVTGKDGLFLFSAEKGKSQAIKPFYPVLSTQLAEADVYGGILLNDGNYAFNTLVDGIYIVSKEGKIQQHISRKEGLQNEVVIGIYQDMYNQLWCALDNGISLVSLNSPIKFAKEGSTFNGAVQAIAKYNGEVFIGTSVGVYRYSENTIESTDSVSLNSTIVSQLPEIKGFTYDMLQVGKELLIAGSYGVYKYYNNELRQIMKDQIRVLKKVNAYAHKVVLTGGTSEITVLKETGEKWEVNLSVKDIPGEVTSIAQDFEYLSVETDSLVFWFGTSTKGAFRVSFNNDFSDYSLSVYSKEQNMQLTDALVFTHKSSVGFCFNNGVYKYDNSKQKFVEDESKFGKALFSIGDVNSLQESHNGRVWVGSARQLAYLTSEKDGSYSTTNAGYMDIGNINCIYPETGTICWAGGDQALARYDSQVQKELSSTFYCLIQEVKIGYKDTLYNSTISAAEGIELNYKQNSLGFVFTSTFFEYSDEITYSTKLEGYEMEFTPWLKKNEANYPNLSEGNYTFIVKAKNAYGKESEIATFSFVISPPWYRTWLAYLGYLLALIALVYIIVRVNQNRLLIEKQRLEKIIKSRTKEIQEKNKTLEEKNKDITDSIMYAEKIQSALISSDDLFKRFLPQHFILFKPKDILSGDFYWMHPISNSEIMYATVDCTGHGVPGALMSIIGSTFLNEIIIQNNITDTNRVLNMLRLQIIKALGQTGNEDETRDGMDMALCKLDTANNTLEYAGANNPIYIIRKGELLEYKANKQPIGYHIGLFKPFKKQVIEVEKGDVIYTFSDGYFDQFDKTNKEKFKSSRFKELILSIAEEDMETQRQILDITFEEWKGETEQIDDVCVIGVKI